MATKRQKAQGELGFAKPYESKIGLVRAAKGRQGKSIVGAAPAKNEMFMKFSRMTPDEETKWRTGYSRYKQGRQKEEQWRNRHKRPSGGISYGR